MTKGPQAERDDFEFERSPSQLQTQVSFQGALLPSPRSVDIDGGPETDTPEQIPSDMPYTDATAQQTMLRQILLNHAVNNGGKTGAFLRQS